MQTLHPGCFSVLPVTFPAELRYVCPVDRGSIVVFGLGGMGTMAIGTIGSILNFIVVCLAMAAGKIIIEDLSMAGRTVHRLIGGTGPLEVIGDSRVAFGALDVLMYGVGQDPVVHIK